MRKPSVPSGLGAKDVHRVLDGTKGGGRLNPHSQYRRRPRRARHIKFPLLSSRRPLTMRGSERPISRYSVARPGPAAHKGLISHKLSDL